MLPQWTTRIQAGTRSEHRCCYHAGIFRDDILACRVSLAGASITHEAATEALAVRVREWIIGLGLRNLLSSSSDVPVSLSS